MRIRSTYLITVTKIVFCCACVAGLTATACGQWWTTYNPNPIFGYWHKDTPSGLMGWFGNAAPG